MVKTRKITVVVPIRIEVDPQEWAQNNGLDDDGSKCGYSVSAVRKDIASYVIHQVRQMAQMEETSATVNGVSTN